MPRTARLKPRDRGTSYHVTNRIAGVPGEFPFGDVEKAKFVELLKEEARYFTVQLLAHQVLGNHYHVACHAPAATLPPGEAARRHNRFYGGRKPRLDPDDPRCLVVAEQMRDISAFIGRVQQRFSSWFNKTRPTRRRGTLWAGRFKSVVLARGTALWNCLCYIEMNPVRAGLVRDPADYRFGSWGEWCGTGRHPHADNLRRLLPQHEGDEARARTLEQIRRRFRTDLARQRAEDAGASPAEAEEAASDAGRGPAFLLRLDRRVRYWSDGLVIGGRAFVVETAARVCGAERARQHRLEPASGPGGAGLYAYRRLRRLPA
jgi:hypothetical protein